MSAEETEWDIPIDAMRERKQQVGWKLSLGRSMRFTSEFVGLGLEIVLKKLCAQFEEWPVDTSGQ